jgi:hypothetical protein
MEILNILKSPQEEYYYLDFQEKMQFIKKIYDSTTRNLFFEAQQAHRGREEWTLDIPLEDIVLYSRYSNI